MKNQIYILGFIASLLLFAVAVRGTTPINGKYYLSQWSSPSFTNALTELNALNTPVVLVIDQSYTMTTASTIDTEVSLEFIPGNIITTGSNSLWVTGTISAGLYQIFSGSTVYFGNGGTIPDVYPQWWGAQVNGTTDDTAAINAALNSFSETSHPGASGWGLGTIRLSKGKWLVNGTIDRSGALVGVRFVGDGEYATSLITTEDDTVMFNVDNYTSVEFANMAIIHDSVANRESWSNVVFQLNGSSSGRTLRLNHITTRGFDTVVKYDNIGAGNEDTTYAEHCTFQDCNVFCDSLSTSGTVNTYVNCTWTGAMTYAFYVAGSARTKIISGNVVIDGPFIYFRNAASTSDISSLWLLENVKLEWTAAYTSPNSAAKFIDTEAGSDTAYYIRMEGCAVLGGSTPDAGNLWARFTGETMQVDVLNCQFEGLVETKTRTSYYQGRKSYLKFVGCGLKTPDTWVYTDTQVADSVYPNMSFEDCKIFRSSSTPITNITIAKAGVPFINPERTSLISDMTTAIPRIGLTGTAQHEMPSYGQRIEIKKVRLFIDYRAGNAKTVYLYSDAARTNQIGTISVPSGTLGTDTIVDAVLTTTPALTTEGLYTSVALDSTLKGYYIVEYGSR